MDLPDPLDAVPAEEAVCDSDIFSVGMLPWEAATLPIRVLATLVTASIMSAWCDRIKVRRRLLFFAHWASGLVYLLSEWAMATIILACWSNTSLLWFIKLLKFVELTADNMLAITDIAICVQLGIIVSSANAMATVWTVGSPKTILLMVVVSATLPATATAFWRKKLVTTGTQYWLESGPTQSSDAWMTVTSFFLELAIGLAMLVVVGLLFIARRAELRKCWETHCRIRYYFGLTCTAIAVNLAIGVGGLLWVSWKRDPRLIMIGWSLRHVHIGLDTVVLYGVLVGPSQEARGAGEGGRYGKGNPSPARPALRPSHRPCLTLEGIAADMRGQIAEETKSTSTDAERQEQPHNGMFAHI